MNNRDKTIKKITTIMESLNSKSKDKESGVKFVTEWGDKKYGIIYDGKNYIIKEATNKGDSVNDFKYINGVQNKLNYTKSTYNEALHKLNMMLSGDKEIKGVGKILFENMNGSLDEKKYVIKQDNEDMGGGENVEDVENIEDMGDENIEDDMGGEDMEGEQNAPEFMQKYGEILNDFDSADTSDKKWLLNSLIAKMDPEMDGDAISSVKEKLNNLEGGGENEEGDLNVEENYIVETLTKKLFMEKYAPFIEKPSVGVNDKERKNPHAKTGNEKKDNGVYSGKSDPNETDKNVYGEAGKKMKDESNKGNPEFSKGIFKLSKDPNATNVFEKAKRAVKEGKENSPFTELLNTNEFMATDGTIGVGIERYGENKPEFQDSTARMKTNPSKIATQSMNVIRPLDSIALISNSLLEDAGLDLEELLS